MIDSEDDVRAYVRQASAGQARWVEPALGSTPGLPDCWVPMRCGRQVHLELKCGELKDGVLCFTVRPEQRREIKKMASERVPVGFLIGLSDSHSLAFTAATKESLCGKVLIASNETPRFWADSRELARDGFWAGVNFIFSDFASFL